MGHNTAAGTKNISCMKGEDTADHSTVTKWFKKFCSGCKNLDDQSMSAKLKTMDSKAMLQANKANPVSSTQRVSGELGFS